MSDSISLPFLIMATGTILFVYMSVALWQAVKESDLPKVYSSDLRERYKMLLAKKEKSFSNFKTSKENKGHE